MLYHYGSQPANNYGYKCFVKYIAPVLSKNDCVFFCNQSLQWRDNPNRIPFDLFRNICHWKSPRRFNKVLDNTVYEVNRRWKKALQQLNGPPFQQAAIRCALKELTALGGVAVPTASALLTAWNPDQFGIMDFKTLAVLGMPQRSSAKSYVAFRKRLLDLKNTHPELHNSALRQIELALWYYYPIQKEGRAKRQNN